MILYDQNYNFLGISSETVNFLGYEDIQEFLSMNSDFANLLVPNEGKIYKFKNFSWIDFLLYSGASNKLATVTLKDGSEIDIKLTVKEIIFAKEVGGLEKCYAVRVISDRFVNIASKVNENMKFEVKSNVNLNSLLIQDNPLLKDEVNIDKVVDPIQKEISQALNKPRIEDEINIPSFDFPPADELKKEMDEASIVEENEVTEKDEDEEIDFNFITSDELNIDIDEGIKIDLTSDKYQEDIATEVEISQADCELKYKKDIEIELTDDTQKSEPSIFNLNFLKTKEETKEETKVQVPQEINLNFLKKYTDSDDKQSEVMEEKRDIINQIKNDINEIDENRSTIIAGSFVRNVFNDDNTNSKKTIDTKKFENHELIINFINESQTDIEQLNSFLADENYESAIYPIKKMQTSADILNLNDIISSLNSIKSSAQLEEKESLLNNINLLKDKLNILNSKTRQEATFS